MNNINLRNQQIDFLRGIAILLVLFLHFHLAYHLDQSALNKIFSPDFINAMFRNGNYGVTIFFVISGFLITLISYERYQGLQQVNVLHFYTLRFARLMPCLLLAIILILLLNFTPLTIFANKPNTTSLFLTIFSILTFWHNVLMAKVGYFNYCLNIYWSLSVEEAFYIIFPLACIFFKKIRSIFIFWLILIIIGPIYRSFYTDNEIVALYGYFSCFDGIALGCCTAIIARKVSFPKWFLAVSQYIAWLIGITVYLYSDIMSNVVFGISIIAICTSILLLAAVQTYKIHADKFLPSVIHWFGKNSVTPQVSEASFSRSLKTFIFSEP